MSEESMSENSESGRTAAENRSGVAPVPGAGPGTADGDAGDAEGQYVEGDYGDAGEAGVTPPAAEESGYATGDYGGAGTAGAAPAGAPEGDYPEGDYGTAGEPGGAAGAGATEGEYPAGDYGTAGTADPRQADQRRDGSTGSGET